ncbi:hypothetical protein, partial [Segatella oris]
MVKPAKARIVINLFIIMNNKFGDSGARVVIEEFLDGEEFSLFA